jgi:NitT/TauT family transport system ATP-binding protein
MTKLRLLDVTQVFQGNGPAGTVRALSHFSLGIEAESFVCLLGPSGCGKSTVLNLLAGFETPTEGSVLIDGKPVVGPGRDRGIVFQEPLLLPWRTVLENVRLGADLAGRPRKESSEKACHFLRLTGLEKFERHAPYQLSGGMRQRVALARALIGEPPVLLMDEPFGALDAQTRLSMQELLLEIWEQTRTTVLFVTHDIDEALFLGDRVVVLSASPGRVLLDLPVVFPRPRTEEVLTTPEFADAKRRCLRLIGQESRRALGLLEGDGI